MFSYLYKKIAIGVSIALLGAVVVIPASHLFGADSPAVAYLKGKPLSPWSIMALAATGEHPDLESLKTVPTEKAIDLEAPILALTAAGKDPRTFGSADLIAQLKNFYDGTGLGDSALLNDDIFGLLALIGSGEKADNAILLGIKDFIISKKGADGGFPFAVGGTSDTNTTAAAIMALRAVGVQASDPVLANAVSYLKSAQNDDGGFPYDPKSSWGTASDASSDAWVMMAIKALGEDVAIWQKNGKTPATHLESLKQEGGFYLYQAGGQEDGFTPITTSYALLALSGKTLPVRIIQPETSTGVSFSVQVEGNTSLLCDTDGVGKTALDALKIAAGQCDFPYHIQSSALGDYVDEIAGEKASGAFGWLYRVNGAMGSVGAGAYTLKEGDAVRWYFGNFDGTAASDAVRTEVPLSVTIPPPPPQNSGDGNESDTDSTISMLVLVGKTGGGVTNDTLEFGTISRGGVAMRVITLKNIGAVASTLSTSISGDAVFRRYVQLNEKPWREYQVTLQAKVSTTTRLSLSVPADYQGSGTKSGALVFWATPVAQ